MKYLSLVYIVTVFGTFAPITYAQSLELTLNCTSTVTDPDNQARLALHNTIACCPIASGTYIDPDGCQVHRFNGNAFTYCCDGLNTIDVENFPS